MSQPQRILLAGIGNIFFGDDAFGCEVAQRLTLRAWPPEVVVRDFGIRGLDLAYALVDAHDLVILVDAVPHGQAPGTIYVIEPDIADEQTAKNAAGSWNAHSLDPVNVLNLAKSLGAALKNIVLLGCEPSPWSEDCNNVSELSAPVRAAVDDVVQYLSATLPRLCQGEEINFSQWPVRLAQSSY